MQVFLHIDRYCDVTWLHRQGMYLTPNVGGKAKVGTRLQANCLQNKRLRCGKSAVCMPNGRLNGIEQMCFCEGEFCWFKNTQLINKYFTCYGMQHITSQHNIPVCIYFICSVNSNFDIKQATYLPYWSSEQQYLFSFNMNLMMVMILIRLLCPWNQQKFVNPQTLAPRIKIIPKYEKKIIHFCPFGSLFRRMWVHLGKSTCCTISTECFSIFGLRIHSE